MSESKWKEGQRLLWFHQIDDETNVICDEVSCITTDICCDGDWTIIKGSLDGIELSPGLTIITTGEENVDCSVVFDIFDERDDGAIDHEPPFTIVSMVTSNLNRFDGYEKIARYFLNKSKEYNKMVSEFISIVDNCVDEIDTIIDADEFKLKESKF